MRWLTVTLVAAVFALGVAAPATADWYDDFADMHFWYDSNYAFDPNLAKQFTPYPSPPYDPGDWDRCNPQWDFMPFFGVKWEAGVATHPVVGSNWIWMITTPNPFFVYTFFCAFVDDGDHNPATSTTWFDDTGSHYMLARISNPQYQADPNNDAGYVRLLMNANTAIWTTLWITYEWYDDRPWAGAWYCIEFQYGDSESIRLPNGIAVKDPNIDEHQYDPNDPNWDADHYRNHPVGYMDEPNGFWLLLQFEVYDANYGLGDPNGKAVWSACWNGDKYDWDGEYMIGTDFPNYPNHPRARSEDITKWNDGEFYWYEGVSGVATSSSSSENPAAIPDGGAFTDIEMRWGTFTNVSKNLNLTVTKSDMGSVHVCPGIPDPNDTGDPNDRLYRYTNGTPIVLTAQPLSGKSLKQWTIYDPNYPGDANYVAYDTNTVLYLTMDADWEVNAKFKCGSSVPPFVAMTLLALGLGLAIRRFR